MKEVALYLLLGVSSLVVLGYSIHMFVGGLVSPETEFKAIVAACLIGAVVMGYLVKDVVRERRKNKKKPYR